jgi:hypothetical protein
MKILFIGDIIGGPGRRAVRELVPSLIEDYRIDMVIANCENAAAGFGITREIVEELYRLLKITKPCSDRPTIRRASPASEASSCRVLPGSTWA